MGWNARLAALGALALSCSTATGCSGADAGAHEEARVGLDRDRGGGADLAREVRQDPLATPLRELVAASRIPSAAGFANGFPRWVRGAWQVEGADPVARAQDFVRRFAGLYRRGEGESLRVGRVHLHAPDRGHEHAGDTVVLEETYRGVPVLGGQLVFQLDGAEVRSVLGSLLVDGLTLDPRPRLTAGQAEELVRDQLEVPDAPILSDTGLWIWDPSLAEPSVAPDPRLAYAVVFAGQRVLVDAHDGAILEQLDTRQELNQIEIWNAQGLAEPGTNCFEGWTDLAATDAAVSPPYLGDDVISELRTHAVYARSWYFDRFGVQGFYPVETAWDLLLATSPTTLYGHYESGAAYTPGCNAILIGDGGVADDVVVHEWTHGVVYFSSALEAEGQPRTLNESFADTMAFLATGDWVLGEDAGDGIVRNGADPASLGCPDAMDDTFDPTQHYRNACITDKAQYLMTEGGVHRGWTVDGMGTDKAAQLVYAVMTSLPSTATLEQAAVSFASAAALWAQFGVHGFTEDDVCSAENGWAAVGLGTGDADCDGTLDTSDVDDDGDGVGDAGDNCDLVVNPSQHDTDFDGKGDVCDPDDDGDGVPDVSDNCEKSNAAQADSDGNGIGDICEDYDLDFVLDATDNCMVDSNPDQADADGDGVGDVCDLDPDLDGVSGDGDDCPFEANADQADLDLDGLGDACDPCPASADDVSAWSSGIPELGIPPKPILTDTDGDGTPDACDPEIWGSRVRVRVGGLDLSPRDSPFAVDAAPVRVDVDAPPGSSIELRLPSCPAERCGDWLDAGDALNLSIDLLSDDVTVWVLDDRGHTMGRSTAAPRGARGGREPRPLGFLPVSGRSYRLLLQFADDFPVGAAGSLEVTLERP